MSFNINLSSNNISNSGNQNTAPMDKCTVLQWRTLAKGYKFKMKSIEMFAIKLLLMIDADRFLRVHTGFGWFAFTSWIDQLVKFKEKWLLSQH